MDKHINEIFNKIDKGEDITLGRLIETRNFCDVLGGKFRKLDKEISYKVSYGDCGKEGFMVVKSNDKSDIIEDVILSKFNSLIFHSKTRKELSDTIRSLLKSRIKFVPGGLLKITKFERIKTSKSKYGSVEISSLLNTFRELKITETDLCSCGFFDLFDDQKFLQAIKSKCNALVPEPKFLKQTISQIYKQK